MQAASPNPPSLPPSLPPSQIINTNYKKSVPTYAPPTAHNLNDNFMLYAGQSAGSDSGGMYANLDATYLMALGFQPAVEDHDSE
jgi:hypothetical protein